MIKNKKIFISGAGGMLGEACFKIFNKNNILKCTDINLNENWLDFLDITDEEKYKKEVLNFKPDYLFHLGAITSLEECEENPDKAYLTNTISVETAVMIANYLKIKLIYISTAGIFDGKKDSYNDWDKPNPISIYGKSKFYAEEFVQKNSLDYLILRPGWMMGGGPKKDKKFINLIYKQIKEGKKNLKIVNDKNGTPTYTYDFVKNIELLILNNNIGLFNCVCEGLTDRLEVAKEILQIVNLDNQISIDEVDSNFFNKNFYADRPKSERLINYKLSLINKNIMRNWKICLKEYLKNHFTFHEN